MPHCSLWKNSSYAFNFVNKLISGSDRWSSNEEFDLVTACCNIMQHTKPFYYASFCWQIFFHREYRIHSKKRPGVYLIFVYFGAALVRGRRFFEWIRNYLCRRCLWQIWPAPAIPWKLKPHLHYRNNGLARINTVKGNFNCLIGEAMTVYTRNFRGRLIYDKPRLFWPSQGWKIVSKHGRSTWLQPYIC